MNPYDFSLELQYRGMCNTHHFESICFFFIRESEAHGIVPAFVEQRAYAGALERMSNRSWRLGVLITIMHEKLLLLDASFGECRFRSTSVQMIKRKSCCAPESESFDDCVIKHMLPFTSGKIVIFHALVSRAFRSVTVFRKTMIASGQLSAMYMIQRVFYGATCMPSLNQQMKMLFSVREKLKTQRAPLALHR